MVEREPFLEAPFEEASNLSFEVLLGIGVALLAAVAVLGRSTVTTAAVALYLLLIPGYIWYRIRVWDRNGANDGSGGDSSDDAEAEPGGEGDE